MQPGYPTLGIVSLILLSFVVPLIVYGGDINVSLPKGFWAPATPKRTLIYMSTHLSSEHVQFLQHCWPHVVATSSLVRNADVLVFITGQAQPKITEMLSSIFKSLNVTIKVFPNPGYQEGAILALDEALLENWFGSYNWVVRVNPDVIIRNDSWILETMNDTNVDGIFVDCIDTPCALGRCCKAAQIHTDFFVVRPHAIARNVTANLTSFKNAEWKATSIFRSIVVSGRDRWLPTGSRRNGECRVRGNSSPVVHDHSYYNACKHATTGMPL